MNKKRIFISIILTAFLLFGLSIAGSIRIEKVKSDHRAIATVQEKVTEADAGQIVLTSKDQEFLDQLLKLVSKGNLKEAAKHLNGYKVPWKKFPCMYDGTALKAEVSSGRGLVFTKPFTIFFGNFHKGKPEGQCVALQVLDLEEGRRYDYSVGMWKNGKMNGEGVCGYNYYEGAAEEVAKEISKKGNFQDDLMQGEITYTSTNESLETAAWQFQVIDGVIVPDDKWIKDTDNLNKVSYKRMAENDDVHAYTLSERAMKDDRWRNLIVYVPAF